MPLACLKSLAIGLLCRIALEACQRHAATFRAENHLKLEFCNTPFYNPASLSGGGRMPPLHDKGPGGVPGPSWRGGVRGLSDGDFADGRAGLDDVDSRGDGEAVDVLELFTFGNVAA